MARNIRARSRSFFSAGHAARMVAIRAAAGIRAGDGRAMDRPAGGSWQADQGGWVQAQEVGSCLVRDRAAAVIRTTAISLGLKQAQEGGLSGHGEVLARKEHRHKGSAAETVLEALA